LGRSKEMCMTDIVKGPEHFIKALDMLWHHGKAIRPRGLDCKEVVGLTYVLPPRVRFMCFDERKLKLDYVKQEFLWYFRGERYDTSIQHVAKMWKDLINKDGTINSNYGQYIFETPFPESSSMSNFERVVQELKNDQDSRRAVVCILKNTHLNSITKDYPCTCYLNFLIRNNRLILIVRMRSQDAIYGMGNDAPAFSFIHELMLYSLKNAAPARFSGLQLGDYVHSADSFHVY
jgi:thymidylate synthase